MINDGWKNHSQRKEQIKQTSPPLVPLSPAFGGMERGKIEDAYA